MPVTNWNTTTIDGKEYLVIDSAQFRVPLDWDPSSNMFIAVAAPSGGLGNFPALVKGDSGKHAEIDDTINLTLLEFDDPTPDSADWTTITPPDDTTAGVYQLNLTIHKSEPGADGTTSLDLDSIDGDVLPKRMIVVNATSDGFEYQSQKIGDRYYPVSISAAPSGNSAYTLCPIGIAAQDFDWRPECDGECVVTGTGADLLVDYVVRLQVGLTSAETSGNVVARALGNTGQNPPPHVLGPITPADLTAGGADFDKVPAGSPATLWFRIERQSGSDTFTTSSTRTTARVRVAAIP